MVHAQDSKGNAVLTPISELKIGDKVLAKSEWKPEEESLSYEPITDIISTPDSVQKWVHLTLADGKTIDATEGHPFNTPDGWREAILLKKGGELILKGENGEAKSIAIADVSVAERRLTTYNLEVANAHTFFVGEDAVLVHNSVVNTGGRFAKIDADRQSGEVGHHMPQNAYNKTIGLSRSDGPALGMTEEDHALTRTYRGRGKATMRADCNLSALERLLLDIEDIKTLFGDKYNEGIEQVLEYAKTLPEFQK